MSPEPPMTAWYKRIVRTQIGLLLRKYRFDNTERNAPPMSWRAPGRRLAMSVSVQNMYYLCYAWDRLEARNQFDVN